jgi:arylsulfatase A-like enzyme
MNVVVVACNGLHLGFLGPYGNAWIETPHFDRLATEAVVFDQHFAENLTTLPTRRSWWTGRYGFADPDQGWTPLRPDERILPDLLWDHGVQTSLISDNPYLREAGHGFGRGFDEVLWVRGSGYDPFVPVGDPRAVGIRVEDEPGLPLPPVDDPDREVWLRRWGNYLRNRAVLGLNADESRTNVARAVGAAIDWLERRPAGRVPFLLWLDLFSPHGPWDPPAPFRDLYATVGPDEFETDEEGDLAETMLGDEAASLEGTRVLIDVPPGVVGEVLSEHELLRLRRTYAGCITLLDKQFGVLFDTLRRMGRLDDTLLIFTADQGEPLGEHGLVRRFRPWLYEELIHTPLIVRLPGAERGGTRHQALVQPVDLLPTVASALGVGLPDEPGVHGHDLLPLIRAQQTKLRDYACLGMDVEEFAIRTHNWHLVVPLEADPDDPPRGPELYRKPEDRWDQDDVAEQYPEVAEHLELALRRFAEAARRDEPLEDLPPLREVARLGRVL